MKPYEPVFPVISDEIFTDREDLLSVLKQLALETKNQINISHVLIGHRRVGKTEVLKRLYNQLFWEQNDVVPVYITFETLDRESRNFATRYLMTFLSQYVGFKEKDVALVRDQADVLERTKALARREHNEGLEHLLKRYRSALEDQEFTWPILDCAIEAPRFVSDWNKEPMFVMLDEFQHVIEIRDEDGVAPNALGKYQYAVESRLCPHLVTGSAVTLLTKDIIGRGGLFGRFRAEYIRGLESYYVTELCEKLGRHYNVQINPEMAAELTRRTGGNPFYIDCIFAGAKRIAKHLTTFEEVNEVLTYELTQGTIWSELYRQLNYSFNTINERGITKNIFYFAVQHQDEEINPQRIAKAMSHWGINERQVREILLALSRADVIEEKLAGTAFYNIKDPILREFAAAWARVEVENASWEQASTELQEKYRRLTGKYADFKGYATELMVKFFMSRFNDQTVDGGEYFSHPGEVFLPRFIWIDSRTVKAPDTREYQIDIIGKEVPHLWLVEVKNTDHPIGLSEVREFQEACEVAERVIGGEIVTRWYVSTGGFTEEAVHDLQERGFLFSDRGQVNGLLQYFGLRELPV
jgi:hypothetical protein